MVLEVMCSQGNLAFTYGGVGRDQIQYGSTLEDEHIKPVLRFIHTLQGYILWLKEAIIVCVKQGRERNCCNLLQIEAIMDHEIGTNKGKVHTLA